MSEITCHAGQLLFAAAAVFGYDIAIRFITCKSVKINPPHITPTKRSLAQRFGAYPLHPTLLLLLLLCLPFPVLSQSGPSQTIPSNVEAKLQRDAARLALRAISESGLAENQHIVIPRQKIEAYYGALATLYRKSERARAIHQCDVHTFPEPPIDRMVIIFLKSAPWAAPLRRGEPTTGHAHLDGLLARYKLNIGKYVAWDDAHDALVLQADEPLNIAALAHVFKKIDHVAKVETGVPETSGNDIRARTVGGGIEITYILRFGSHISGSGKAHKWKFLVRDDGNVVFLNESGDEIPPWMECAK